MAGAKDERAQRLAEQLRANLRRRKGQARARSADAHDAHEGPAARDAGPSPEGRDPSLVDHDSSRGEDDGPPDGT